MTIISRLVIASLLSLCMVFSLDSAAFAAKKASDSSISQKGNNAESFIKDLGERAIRSLTEGDQAQIDATFLQLLDEGFDLDYIARFVMGRYWKLFNEAQKTEFKTIFRLRLKDTYAKRFREYKGVVFQIKSNHVEGGKEVVETTIQKPGGVTTPVQWEVVRSGSRHKVRDVVVEGISMSQTMRGDYSAAYQAAGGTAEKFLKSLTGS